MKFIHRSFGTAIYLNDELIGWILFTLNQKYTYTLLNHPNMDKELFDSRKSAILYVTKLVGD